MRHLLEAEHKPKAMVLTVQKVAQRICAPAGKLSLLALSVQVLASQKLAGFIPANSFYPAPEVGSAVLQVELYPHPLIPLESLDLFFKLAHAGFWTKTENLTQLAFGQVWNGQAAKSKHC